MHIGKHKHLTRPLFHLIAVLKLRPGFTAPALPRFLLPLESGPDGGPVVVLTFFKYGREGVTIETRIGDGPSVTFSPIVTTPTRDTRPLLTPGQPELRSYRMRFWHKGHPTGDWTPWRQIAVAPA